MTQTIETIATPRMNGCDTRIADRFAPRTTIVLSTEKRLRFVMYGRNRDVARSKNSVRYIYFEGPEYERHFSYRHGRHGIGTGPRTSQGGSRSNRLEPLA